MNIVQFICLLISIWSSAGACWWVFIKNKKPTKKTLSFNKTMLKKITKSRHSNTYIDLGERDMEQYMEKKSDLSQFTSNLIRENAHQINIKGLELQILQSMKKKRVG